MRPEATRFEVNSVIRSINVKISDVIVISIVRSRYDLNSKEVLVIRIEIEDDILLLWLGFLIVCVVL